MVGDVPVGGDAPISVQSMTITKTADVEGTLQQIYALAAAGADIVRCTCNERRGGRGPGPDRAPLAGADRRRHPPPVPDGARRARGRRALPAPQPGQHPQARAHQAGGAGGQGPGRPDPHRRQRRLARPDALREARRPGHARGDGRVGAAGAGLLRRGRLRRREDLGQGVERAADDRGLPPAGRGHRPPAAPRRHRGRAAARRAWSRPPPASPRCWPRASATPSATRSPPTRSRRPGPGASCSRRWACASARTSTSSPARPAAGPRST